SLSRLAQTTFDDVHWGLVVRNQLRLVPTAVLLNSHSDSALLSGSRLFEFGEVGNAAGDPTRVAYDVRGNLLVALAGVDEVGVTANLDQAPRRVAVGFRPVAILPTAEGESVYVANSLDDTVSVVKLTTGQHLATISLGPRRQSTTADRGERLFYSAKL